MFSPRLKLIVLSVTAALTIASCSSHFGPRLTPTPPAPTSTPAPPTATPEPMTATVNGEVITVAEFQAQLAEYKTAQTALNKTVTSEDASKTVLEDLIAQVLLAQAAKAAGFSLTDTAVQAKIEALATQVGGADKLSKWETGHGYNDLSFRVALRRASEAAWMRDKIVTAVPKTADQVHVQQMLFYNEGDAQSALTQLKSGTDFNTLAKQVDSVTRGELGWFPKGYLLESKIEETAFSLPVGQYSDVIQSTVGWHIIKVLERDPQHPLSPDAYLAMQELELKAWVAKQRTDASVVLAP